MRVVLFQPQIPQNTGNIVRSCAVTGAQLTLITPLGFSLSARQLRRAGLDYWEGVDVEQSDSLEHCIESYSGIPYFFSSKGERSFADVSYKSDDLLIFGSEPSGLPSWVFEQYPEQCVRIPMRKGVRCLNLATSVGIGLYEAWRQQGYSPLPEEALPPE